MAASLQNYERAVSLRAASDDDLLKQIFNSKDGDASLDEALQDKPSLIETARSYLPHLTSSTYERLVREPTLLQSDKDRCEKEMEHLAVKNYGAFISNAQVTRSVRSDFGNIQKGLDAMSEIFDPLRESVDDIKKASLAVNAKRSSLRNVLQQHNTLLELLELPQLLDACIRNQMFDDSIELLSFSAHMFQVYETRDEKIPIVDALREQIAQQRAHLQGSLVMQLKMDIHLPACVRVIGYLRRLQQYSETELREIFIENRGAFLEAHKQQIELMRNNRNSVVNALRAAADLVRTHVFDIGMQYKALFSQDDAPLSMWLNTQICWLIGMFRSHLLPQDPPGVSQAAKKDPNAKKMVEQARIDAPALAAILRQCMHASSTLKRLGGQFFPAIANIFEARMEHNMCELLDTALLTFHTELSRYDWVASTALTGTGAAATGEEGTTRAQWLHPQALSLTRHRPLAIFANDLIQTFNELRQCALYRLRQRAVDHCAECLKGAVNVIRVAQQQQPFAPNSAKAQEFTRMSKHFAEILVPLVASHLEAIFGIAAKFPDDEILQTMQPDLYVKGIEMAPEEMQSFVEQALAEQAEADASAAKAAAEAALALQAEATAEAPEEAPAVTPAAVPATTEQEQMAVTAPVMAPGIPVPPPSDTTLEQVAAPPAPTDSATQDA